MLNEKALLVGVKFPGDSQEMVMGSLLELEELTKTAGAKVVDIIVQSRQNIDPKFYIGKGKVEEIRNFYDGEDKIDVLILNHEPSPGQIMNIETGLNIKVITRTELIMDIFAIHAKTKSAKLQVELAQLNYQLPRLTGKGASMSRLGGGIGTRGPGEQKLEIDKRAIRRKIFLIKEKLKGISLEMQTRRKSRQMNEKKVGIVGYTNSGKSSLLNRLTNSDVHTEDKLFATLDTTTRKLWINDQLSVVITDTVGFIRDIPHGLIESFKSTFEDTLYSDFLIHLVDASAPDFIEKIAVVEKVLAEISKVKIPMILCFNKIDKLSVEELIDFRLKYPQANFISVKDDKNIDALKETISQHFALK